MMIFFVSQREKKPLNKPCIVLDAFACRIDNRAWHIEIIKEELFAVKNLPKTATKDTAMSCYTFAD